jgi:hypothetical protein
MLKLSYRRVAAINDVGSPRAPQKENAQLCKRAAAICARADVDGATTVEYEALGRVMTRLFDLVSFSFPDPERQQGRGCGAREVAVEPDIVHPLVVRPN